MVFGKFGNFFGETIGRKIGRIFFSPLDKILIYLPYRLSKDRQKQAQKWGIFTTTPFSLPACHR